MHFKLAAAAVALLSQTITASPVPSPSPSCSPAEFTSIECIFNIFINNNTNQYLTPGYCATACPTGSQRVLAPDHGLPIRPQWYNLTDSYVDVTSTYPYFGGNTYFVDPGFTTTTGLKRVIVSIPPQAAPKAKWLGLNYENCGEANRKELIPLGPNGEQWEACRKWDGVQILVLFVRPKYTGPAADNEGCTTITLTPRADCRWESSRHHN